MLFYFAPPRTCCELVTCSFKYRTCSPSWTFSILKSWKACCVRLDSCKINCATEEGALRMRRPLEQLWQGISAQRPSATIKY